MGILEERKEGTVQPQGHQWEQEVEGRTHQLLPPRLVGANMLITSISLAPALCRALYKVLGPRGNTRDTAPGHMEPKSRDWSSSNQGDALSGQ